MRLKFVSPLMPTLVEQPPQGDGWIHEVKFDGYRSPRRDEDLHTKRPCLDGEYRGLVQGWPGR